MCVEAEFNYKLMIGLKYKTYPGNSTVHWEVVDFDPIERQIQLKNTKTDKRYELPLENSLIKTLISAKKAQIQIQIQIQKN